MNDSAEEKKQIPQPAAQKLTEMPDSWLKWIDECISLGCSSEDIINILIDNQYDKEYATHLVIGKFDTATSLNAQTKQCISEPQDYEYEEIGPKFDGHIVKSDNHKINILLNISRPRIILFNNVLSSDECDLLIELSKPKLKKSATADLTTGISLINQNRTSQGTYFKFNENSFIEEIDQRLSDLMQVPLANTEELQTLNYQIGGEYKPHFDYLSQEFSGSQSFNKRGGQRIATLIIYLNNVKQGGETIFPKINLTVSPQQGNALYFAYSNSKNQLDPLTLHGGCPVLKGEKWIATKWVRQNKYR